jgi:hypothetical protein
MMSTNPHQVAYTGAPVKPSMRPPGLCRRRRLVRQEAAAEVVPPRPVFRTDAHGDIEMSTDGEKLWIETEREE